MSFTVTGLSVEPFQHLFALSDEELAGLGVLRRRADADRGFPCRVTLEDAKAGETLLLMNYEHQPANTPFRASHAIFVREAARETRQTIDEIPPALAVRPHISLRAFTDDGMMIDATVAPGAALAEPIEQLLANDEVAYIQAHYAGMGCYAARIERA